MRGSRVASEFFVVVGRFGKVGAIGLVWGRWGWFGWTGTIVLWYGTEKVVGFSSYRPRVGGRTGICENKGLLTAPVLQTKVYIG
jgi:hypothetical protein